MNSPHTLNACIPAGSLSAKWHVMSSKLPHIPPERKQKTEVLVIGGGLAACAASAALAEQGYCIKMITRLESPRHEATSYLRGGLNASKNYANDGDCDERLFRDTLVCGSYRSREADVYRMAQLSGKVLDVCTALGVPFLREDGGLLLPRPHKGGNTSRSFQARGQTGRQLLIAFHSALLRQIRLGRAQILPRREMIELVVHGGLARGVITRNIINGENEIWTADAVVLAGGGYSDLYNKKLNIFYGGLNQLWACYLAGAGLANPAFSLSILENSVDTKPVPEDYTNSQRCSGGLWVDYQLSTTIHGLFAIGESNFSVHGANCLSGNAPLQEIADGLFILPATLGAYIARTELRPVNSSENAFIRALEHIDIQKQKILSAHGKIPAEYFHRQLSKIMRENVGFMRNGKKMQQALKLIKKIKEEFEINIAIDDSKYYNFSYEKAYKTSISLHFAEVLIKDAILRKESCGAHFRDDFNHRLVKNTNTGKYATVWFRQQNEEDLPVKEMLKFSSLKTNTKSRRH